MLLHTCRTPLRYGGRYADDAFASARVIARSLEDLLGASTQAAAMPVRLDVREDEKAFHVMADLPGLSEKDVEITFDEGVLTLRGEKKIVREEKETLHIAERSYGSFARQLALPATVDAEKIEATFEKGVLHIALPKQTAAQAAAKKITIKSS